jgi:hypothetical protein
MPAVNLTSKHCTLNIGGQRPFKINIVLMEKEENSLDCEKDSLKGYKPLKSTPGSHLPNRCLPGCIVRVLLNLEPITVRFEFQQCQWTSQGSLIHTYIKRYLRHLKNVSSGKCTDRSSPVAEFVESMRRVDGAQ